MTDEITFSVRIGSRPNFIHEAAASAKAAEEAGFDQVWTGNDFLGGPGIATMAAMIGRTSTIRIGSGVFDPVTIHPGQLAQLASGFQELSGGRFLLGIGAGSPHFFKKAGVKAGPPLRRTEEALIALQHLAEGESPAEQLGDTTGWTMDGRLEGARDVPIYLGAMGPRMLDLAGRYADGALPLCLPPQQALTALRQVEDGARAVGRNQRDLDVAACVWCSIGDSRDAAEQAMAAFVSRYAGSLSPEVLAAHGLDVGEFERVQALVDAGEETAAIDAVRSSRTMLRLGIVGDAMDVADQCRELLDAGVRHVSFGPPLGPDPGRALRLLGEFALPSLR